MRASPIEQVAAMAGQVDRTAFAAQAAASAPSCASSRWTCMETADCVRPTRSAARVKLPSSAMKLRMPAAAAGSMVRGECSLPSVSLIWLYKCNSFPLSYPQSSDGVPCASEEDTHVANSSGFDFGSCFRHRPAPSACAGPVAQSDREPALRDEATPPAACCDLDDRGLSDIGISRAQAQFQAEQPIWELVPFLHR